MIVQVQLRSRLRIRRRRGSDGNGLFFVFGTRLDNIVRTARQSQGHEGQQVFERTHCSDYLRLDMALPGGA